MYADGDISESGSAGGWRRQELIERRDARADNPVEIGETQAHLERIAESHNQAAWGLKHITRRPRWLWPQSILRRRTRYAYTVEPGVRSRERGDRIDLGVHIWRYTGVMGGWQRVAIVRGVSVPADDPVALGEARAELETYAEIQNRKLAAR